MGNRFKSPEFKKLLKEWNNILEESGHEEIEDFRGDEPKLIQWHGSRWNNTDPIQNELKQQYYEAAEQLLETYKFKNKTERRIWQLHSDGASVMEIRDMVHRSGYKTTRIKKIIREIRRTAGLVRG